MRVTIVVHLTFDVPDGASVLGLCTENLQSELRYVDGPIICEARLIEAETQGLALGDD